MSGKIPFFERGFGVLQNTYASGRLGLCVSHFGGISKLFYWGVCPDESPSVLYEADSISAYARLFRSQMVVDGEPYNFAFSRTEHFSFGYVGHFQLEAKGIEVAHRLTLAEDAVVLTLEVLRNDHGLPISQRFEHHLYTAKARESQVRRKFSDWEPFSPVEGFSQLVHDAVSDAHWAEWVAMTGTAPNEVNFPRLDPGVRESRTRVAFFSQEGPLELRKTMSGRVYFSGPDFTSGSRSCALMIAPDHDAFTSKSLERRSQLPGIAREKENAERARMEVRPSISTGHAAFESLFANVPPALESLFVEEMPGAMRAASTHYWVWGWDTLLCAEAYLLMGRADFVRSALRLYRETAHPEYGYAHCFTRDLKVSMVQAHSAQALYLIALHNYYAFTDDIETVRENFAFAALIFERNLRSINESGLGIGPALFPDFPACAGHNGHDISVFNASLLYQGARAMEVLANSIGALELAGKACALSRRIELNFDRVFWDSEANYFVDSVDSVTGEQRKSYPSHALVWQTPFLEDLVGKRLATCGKFQAKNHRGSRGFVMYPRWDRHAFDGDGNQLGQIWTIPDVFVTRCQAAAGNSDILAWWMEQCAWFWEQLTYIEGYSAQTVNDSGTPDLPGGKQAFGAKSVYMAFLTSVAGLHFDIGGLAIEEGAERTVRITNLPFRERLLNITVSGKGRYFKSLRINGAELRGSRKIPLTILTGRTEIVCERTEQLPDHPVLMSLHGAEVVSIGSEEKALTAVLKSSGRVAVHFVAPSSPRVCLNGRDLDFRYDPETRTGCLELETDGLSELTIQS